MKLSAWLQEERKKEKVVDTDGKSVKTRMVAARQKYDDKTTGDAGAEITQSGTSCEQMAKELLSKNEGLK